MAIAPPARPRVASPEPLTPPPRNSQQQQTNWRVALAQVAEQDRSAAEAMAKYPGIVATTGDGTVSERAAALVLSQPVYRQATGPPPPWVPVGGKAGGAPSGAAEEQPPLPPPAGTPPSKLSVAWQLLCRKRDQAADPQTTVAMQLILTDELADLDRTIG